MDKCVWLEGWLISLYPKTEDEYRTLANWIAKEFSKPHRSANPTVRCQFG